MHIDTLKNIAAAETAKEQIVLVTNLSTGEEHLLNAAALDAPSDDIATAACDAAMSDKSQIVEIGGTEYFVNVFNPPLELIIVGAVHIAQALAPMAQLAGYDVSIIDPREAFADDDRFPETRLISQWPDEALKASVISKRTAIVTLTHDPKLDDAALGPALSSDAFYIGALGSKKTQTARRNRLARAGHTEDSINRVCGPVGLAIGARNPAEIAIAILAQMTAHLRGGLLQ